MRTYRTFDRFYWEYVAQTFPDAYHEFRIFFSSFNFSPEIFNDPKHAKIQIACVMEFANQSQVPFQGKVNLKEGRVRSYDIKADNKHISGLIYEWFCELQENLHTSVKPVFIEGSGRNRPYLIGESNLMSASGW